jgi:hypothetical protein
MMRVLLEEIHVVLWKLERKAVRGLREVDRRILLLGLGHGDWGSISTSVERGD